MKKIFFFAALFAAAMMNAGEITLDLSKATKMAFDECDATPSYADGVLTVNYTTAPGTENWLWAGIEIPIDNISKITSIKFELKGDGKNVACIPYLRDSEGARWAYGQTEGGDSAPVLSSTEWINDLSSDPNMLLWDAATYPYGEKPFVQVGFIANPANGTTGSFALRNVKVVTAGGTGIENTAVEAKATKSIRNGQLIIVRDGKTFNVLGTAL